MALRRFWNGAEARGEGRGVIRPHHRTILSFAAFLVGFLLLLQVAGAADTAVAHQTPFDAGVPFCNGGPCGWKYAKIPSSVSTAQTNLNGIAYVDASTLVVVGGQGTILRSTDGGLNWTLIPSPLPGLTLQTVTEVPGVGVLIAGGLQGKLIESQNGGASWIPYYPSGGLQGNVTEMGFASLSFGYASTSAGLFTTRNAGASWTALALPVKGDVWSASFFSSSNGWIDAGSYPQVYTTTDGGSTWKEHTLLQNTFTHASYIVATGPLSAWVLGYQGTVWRTTDGSNYTEMSLSTAQYTHQIYVTGSYAWVVSDDANTFYTRDGGACWVEESVPSIPELYAVNFYTPQDGVAAGDGVMWYTTDAGLGGNDILSCQPSQSNQSAVAVFLSAAGAGIVAMALYYAVFRKQRQEKTGAGIGDKGIVTIRNRRNYRGRRRFVR